MHVGSCQIAEVKNLWLSNAACMCFCVVNLHMQIFTYASLCQTYYSYLAPVVLYRRRISHQLGLFISLREEHNEMMVFEEVFN